MKSAWMRFSALASVPLALALALASCESKAGPDRESLVDPEARFAEAARECTTITAQDSDGNHYTLAQGGIPRGKTYVERVIGPSGGKLMGSASGHSLTVPQGAVELPTRFQFLVVVDDECVIEVELEAEIEEDDLDEAQQRLAAAWDQRFKKKVILALSFKDAINVTDPRRLRILWDEAEQPRHSGVHVPVESTVDLQKKEVRAGLDHFSRYCLASD